MLQQISLFTENKQGGLVKITSVLAKSHINIYTMLANDSAEFGIIRLIVDRPDEAIKALKEAGYQCRLDKVIAVTMEDVPGYLDKILSAVDGANIDICYLYISFDRSTGKPVAVFKTHEPETATFLLGKGFNLVETF
ncbi:amino acid-binding protein [Anaerovibrio lipolyticus]|uniref:amino acid-binding protein n=1 Tax=Anaerovibrio lipolyticus TaxID=82374 RepID=UPI0026ED476B|nr:amino acid-binding protein [Anaerovibrio lipolyticus]MBE6104737.1 amino acid-binding protein [Anaerovibrio lipolyticus]